MTSCDHLVLNIFQKFNKAAFKQVQGPLAGVQSAANRGVNVFLMLISVRP